MRGFAFVCIMIVALAGGMPAYGGVQGEEYHLRYLDERDGLSHNHITRVIQDGSGIIWLSTWNGLNRYDGSGFVCFKSEPGDGVSLPSDRIRNIELREDGNLLCLVEDRLFLFDTKHCRYAPIDSATEAAGLRRQQTERAWIAQLSSGKSSEKILGKDTLRGIVRDYRDRQGNRWLVDGNGVYVASKVEVRGRLLTHKEARALCVLRDGSACYAERGEGVYAILEDRRGRLWTGRKPGSVVQGRMSSRKGDSQELRRLSHAFVRESEGYAENVYEMVEDSLGRIWMASFGGGIVCEGRVFGAGLKVRRLLLTEDGRLYAATVSGLGMIDNIYSDSAVFRLYQREPERASSLSSNAVMDIAQMGDRLYVATAGGGVDILDISDESAMEQPSFVHLTRHEGLGSDAVYQLAVWNDSVLLIQENNGISLLHTGTGEVVNYGSSFFGMSMQMGEVRPVHWKGDTWLLSTDRGILAIADSAFRVQPSETRIAIRSVKKNGEAVDYAADRCDTIVLSPQERSVAIGFAALDYRTDARVLYRTRWYHEGATAPAWSEASSTDEVIFQDMQPGHYVLEIEATNGMGQWTGTRRVLHITVEPTFWESLLGQVVRYGLIALLIAMITSIALRMLYLARKKEELLQAYLRLQERVSMAETAQSPHSAQLVAPGLSSSDEKFLSRLQAFVEAHIDDSSTMVDDMADAMGMSRSSLNQRMHKLFNVSPADFLREARLRHACTLLQTTDMTSKEVAFACGFNDPKYFGKCFKQATGKTPTEWKNAQKEG
ncbi:MAG: helix-turn-helix domain-containing protein [Paludibacteraceae bacterium]